MAGLIERWFWCPDCKITRLMFLTRAEDDQCARGNFEVLCRLCRKALTIIR